MTCHYCNASYHEDEVHVCQAEDLFDRIDRLCDDVTEAQMAANGYDAASQGLCELGEVYKGALSELSKAVWNALGDGGLAKASPLGEALNAADTLLEPCDSP